ncbi:hypothetical protein J4468_01005 [Candidatus Woesearchaeota archaeon]|nr:hypothetical protein [Candidatus Woesearchaeota archaeon]
MMKRGLLVLIVILLFLAGCAEENKVFICPDGTEAESADLCTSENKMPCIEEGKIGAVIPGNECCEGLDSLNPTTPEQNCQVLLGAFVCAKCGDGFCKTGENSCNCPNDCKALDGGIRVVSTNEYTFKTAGETATLDGMEFTLLSYEKDGTSTFDIDGTELALNNVNDAEIFKNKRIVITKRYWTASVGQESYVTIKVEPFALKADEYLAYVHDKITIANQTITISDIEYIDQKGVGFDFNGGNSYKKVILGTTKQLGDLDVTVVEIFPYHDEQKNRYALIKVTA